MEHSGLVPRAAELRAAMRQHGLNGAEIATAAGVTKQFISLALRGRRRCSPTVAQAVAQELGLPVHALFRTPSVSDDSYNTIPQTEAEEVFMSPSQVLMTDDPYLLFEEAAAYTRIKPKTLRHLRAQGEGPPFFKRGQRLMIRRSKLQDWFENTYENAES